VSWRKTIIQHMLGANPRLREARRVGGVRQGSLGKSCTGHLVGVVRRFFLVLLELAPITSRMGKRRAAALYHFSVA